MGLEDCLTTVTYYPVTYEGYIARDETRSPNYRKTPRTTVTRPSKVAYEEYQDFLDVHEFPKTRDKDELMESTFARLLTEQNEGERWRLQVRKEGL